MAKLTHLPAQPFANGEYCFRIDRAAVLYLETGRAVNPLSPVHAPRHRPRPLFEIARDIMAARLPTADGTEGNPFASVAAESDIRAIIYSAIVCGNRGMIGKKVVEVDSEDALALLREYGPPNRPLIQLWDIAAAILYAYLVGVEADA